MGEFLAGANRIDWLIRAQHSWISSNKRSVNAPSSSDLMDTKDARKHAGRH